MQEHPPHRHEVRRLPRAERTVDRVGGSRGTSRANAKASRFATKGFAAILCMLQLPMVPKTDAAQRPTITSIPDKMSCN